MGDRHGRRDGSGDGSDHAGDPTDDHDPDDEHHGGKHEQTGQETALPGGWFRHRIRRNSAILYVAAAGPVVVLPLTVSR